MHTIKLQIEDELYENIKDHQVDIQSKFKEFLFNLTDDGFPLISKEDAKNRISKAVESYKDGTMQTVSHDDMWSSIDSDCKEKLENRV